VPHDTPAAAHKGFLDKYCQDDEDLFLLILHELYHVILGHTRLFPRFALIDNIVYDAVINSMLSRTVGRTWARVCLSVPTAMIRCPSGSCVPSGLAG